MPTSIKSGDFRRFTLEHITARQLQGSKFLTFDFCINTLLVATDFSNFQLFFYIFITAVVVLLMCCNFSVLKNIQNSEKNDGF